MKRTILLTLSLFLVIVSFGQKKVLFDATKAETANNADWIIDADQWNLGYNNGNAYTGGSEANAQRYPTPDQSQITSSTPETFWTGALSAWGIDLVKAGYRVETLPYDGEITYGDANNPQDLSNYDMYVVCEPNFPFTSAEKQAILEFVYNGGILFMIADHNNSDRDGDGWDSPHIWNDLMQNNPVKDNPFGITFDYEHFDDVSSMIVHEPDNPILHGPYGDVTQIEYYGGTSMTIDPDANSSVRALIYKGNLTAPEGNTNVLVAYAHYGKGIVFAFGDSSPFDDGTGDNDDRLYNGWTEDAGGNHRRLIMNASVAALGGQLSAVETISDNMRVSVCGRSVSVTAPAGKIYDIRIYDVQGRVAAAGHFSGTFSAMLDRGVYILRLNDGRQFISRKIVIF